MCVQQVHKEITSSCRVKNYRGPMNCWDRCGEGLRAAKLPGDLMWAGPRVKLQSALGVSFLAWGTAEKIGFFKVGTQLLKDLGAWPSSLVDLDLAVCLRGRN